MEAGSVGPERRPLRLVAAAFAMGMLALVASGCGTAAPASGGAPSGGGGALTTQTAAASGIKAFSACMRSHGVPDFPDLKNGTLPQISQSPGVITVDGQTINTAATVFHSAVTSCRKYVLLKLTPQQTAHMRQQALASAACMRSHGVPNFPDPVFKNGGVGFQIKAESGSDLDPNSPTFQAASKVCMKGGPLAAAPAAAR